jgi:hypothetical protein
MGGREVEEFLIDTIVFRSACHAAQAGIQIHSNQ